MTQSRPLRRDVAALIAFVDSRQNAPHKWGRKHNDCASFVLAAVEAQTGERVAPELDWRSRAEALRVIKQFGSLEAAIDAHFQRIPPAQAMRGDIAGVPNDVLGVHPMIVEGVTLVGPGDGGNQRMTRTAMTCAWSATKLKALT